MKKLFVMVTMIFTLILFQQSTSEATDVYTCTIDGYEVYIDDDGVQGTRGQFIVNGIKIVYDGKEQGSGYGAFYLRGGEYWGRILTTINPYPMPDIPVRESQLLSAIVHTVLQIYE